MEFGVRTRARTLATATAGESSTSKKRKAIDLGDTTPTHTHAHAHAHTHITPPRRRRRRQLRFDTTDEVRSSTETLKVDSRCSSNGSSELVEESLVIGSVADLHSESLPYESSTTCLNCNKRGDITPSSSFREKSDEQEPMESSVSRSRSRPKDEKITSPLQAEIDGFFTTAEKEEQKRFADKYNYDIAKDIPLEGRYEWVRLNDDKLMDDTTTSLNPN